MIYEIWVLYNNLFCIFEQRKGCCREPKFRAIYARIPGNLTSSKCSEIRDDGQYLKTTFWMPFMDYISKEERGSNHAEFIEMSVPRQAHTTTSETSAPTRDRSLSLFRKVFCHVFRNLSKQPFLKVKKLCILFIGV